MSGGKKNVIVRDCMIDYTHSSGDGPERWYDGRWGGIVGLWQDEELEYSGQRFVVLLFSNLHFAFSLRSHRISSNFHIDAARQFDDILFNNIIGKESRLAELPLSNSLATPADTCPPNETWLHPLLWCLPQLEIAIPCLRSTLPAIPQK